MAPVLKIKLQCNKCKVFSSGTVECKNCGAKRTGKEKQS